MALQTRTFSTGDFAYQSTSRSYVLDLIITEESTSVDTNTSSISYRLQLRSGANNRFSDWPINYAVVINGTTVSSGSPKVNQPYNHTTVLASGTVTVPHDSDGSKNLSLQARISTDSRPFLPPTMEISDTLQLTYIPRASQVAATDAYIESTSLITINSKSNRFTHSVRCQFGSYGGYLNENGGLEAGEVILTSTNLPFRVPAQFYAEIPNATSGICNVKCWTYLDGTLIGESSTTFYASANRDLCRPDVSGNVEDVSSWTLSVTGDSKKLVRYRSTARCAISAAAKNGASVVKKYVNGIEIGAEFLDIEYVDTGTFRFEAVDSRGYRNTVTVNAELIPYIVLSANVSAKRDTPTGSTATLTVTGDHFQGSFGKLQNNLQVRYRIDGGAFQWMNGEPKDNSYVATAKIDGLDYRRSYRIEVVAQDQLVLTRRQIVIYEGIPVYNWGKDHFDINVLAKMQGNRVTGLGTPKEDTDAVPLWMLNKKAKFGQAQVSFVDGIATFQHNLGFANKSSYSLLFMFFNNAYIPSYSSNVDGNTTMLRALDYNDTGNILPSFNGNLAITWIAIGD